MVDEKTEWLEKVATELGIWAMQRGGSVEWRFHPDGTYGGYITCLSEENTVTVDFNEDRKTLSVSAGSVYDLNPLSPEHESTSLEDLSQTVEDYVHWLEVQRFDANRKQRREEEECARRNAESIRAKCESGNVPGAYTGRVILNAGFQQVVAFRGSHKIKEGDTVWVLESKPEVES